MKILFTALFLSFSYSLAFAQGLPPIYDNTPTDIYAVKPFVVYEKNVWLENIVQGNDGAFYVTVYPTGKVLKVSADGTSQNYAQISGKIAGIATFGQNKFLVTGWDSTGKPAVFLVDEKQNSSVFTYIDGGKFPNGILPLSKNLFLIADSYAGCIWVLDAGKKTVSVWVRNELLSRFTEKDELPAANGLKMYNHALYVSNTEKQIIVKIPLAGENAGTPGVYIEKLGVDDFDFDASGNMYAATNVYNRVVKVTSDKKISVIAGLEQGAAGATAVLVNKDKAGKPILYVTTCGGMGIPPPTGIEEGKIIAIQTK